MRFIVVCSNASFYFFCHALALAQHYLPWHWPDGSSKISRTSRVHIHAGVWSHKVSASTRKQWLLGFDKLAIGSLQNSVKRLILLHYLLLDYK